MMVNYRLLPHSIVYLIDSKKWLEWKWFRTCVEFGRHFNHFVPCSLHGISIVNIIICSKLNGRACPLQRDHLFDRRDTYHTVTGTYDCSDFIRYNQSQLSNECRVNLKLFDPTRGDIPKCDGGLLRNIGDQYAFVVQLSNYTDKFCVDGLPPLLIYFNISQIIGCERAIRQELSKDSQAYATYDTLSSNLLSVYVQNLNKYYDCNDPRLWKSQDNEQDKFINYQYE